jgi:DNA-binding MarR family transcriptional regulator
MSDRRQELWKMCEGWHTLKRSFGMKSEKRASIAHLTPSQWLALEIVARNKEASVKDISQALSMTSSAATQIVNELIKHGHALKKVDPKDARVSLITLSPKTRQALSTMRTAMLRHMDKLFAVLSDKEFKEYMRLHAKIITNVHP